MELPDELLILIFVLLPVKSLLLFKCVCKHWLSVIQSPQFVEYHCRLSETRSGAKLLCYRKDPVTETYVISIVDRHTLGKLEDLEWPPFLEEEGLDEDVEWPPLVVEEGYTGPTSFLRRIKIFGPVNGIYCIFRSLIDRWVGTLTLWNPATREYKHIHPQISFPFPMHLLGFKDYALMQFHQQEPVCLNIGFGFDHTTNDYKVVVICQWHDEEMGEDVRWHLRVYNHASDTWRTVYSLNRLVDPHPLFEGSDLPFPQIEYDPPISHCLLNGVFHWACSVGLGNDSFNAVLAFDMTSDVLRLMKGPPIPCHLIVYSSVWVLKDTIAAVISTYDPLNDSLNDPLRDIKVWMMMEYGVDDSWVMLFKFNGVSNWAPVGIPYNDRVFFDDESGHLISSDIDEDHQVKEHDVYGMTYPTLNGIRGTLGILDYVETLTTLKPV
ncbi:F-box/kelch-repeat protein At3g23880-like [Silene latifolia]|uniref:F-box/kelch-repeat protein At3g23880-like n=1 Tax=Silene latifolia TaxID=37657 RepID=UPI003D783E93